MYFKSEKGFIKSCRSHGKNYYGFLWALYETINKQGNIYSGLSNLNKIASPLAITFTFSFPLWSFFPVTDCSFAEIVQTFTGKKNESILLQSIPGQAYQLIICHYCPCLTLRKGLLHHWIHLAPGSRHILIQVYEKIPFSIQLCLGQNDSLTFLSASKHVGKQAVLVGSWEVHTWAKFVPRRNCSP